MATSSKSTEKPKPADKATGKPATAKAKPAEAAKAKAVKPTAAPKVPAPKKTAAKAAVAAKAPAPAKKAAAPAAGPSFKMPELTPEQRCYYVEVAAYYIAERRGFHGAGQLDDWVQAEQEIDRLLREGILKP